ncbi:centriolin-like isoform X2 [Osmerus eperlanus]|uniref:centriolin-like isoform X2 n=1 Tax=Osmerus eperlanus TaxID=29151 RepID=UPI002E12B312
MNAQAAIKKQLLDMMSRKHHELEGRLDNMLSRIARETEEIKYLEQQLTDNQILANNVLQKDLEGIIAGLKEYLRGVRDQAHKAQEDCQKLQKENKALKLQLEYSQDNRSQLETAAKATQTCQKIIQMGELDALLKNNAAPRESQGKICAYEAELESQLLEHHMQAGQLKEELERLHRLSLVKQTALQIELEKERQAKQDILAQVQLATEREQKVTNLQKQLSSLQERTSLQEHIQSLQGLLEKARFSLLAPQKVTAHLEELIASVSSEQPQFRIWSKGDVLGCSLEALQQEALQLVFLLTDRQQKSKILQEQQQAAIQASLSTEFHRETELQGLREKLGRLEEELEKANRLQVEVSLQLEQSQEERDCLLAVLEGHCSQARMAEHESQQHMRSLNRLLRKIKTDMSSADKIAAQQLTAATDQLSSLHSTVHRIYMKTQSQPPSPADTDRVAPASLLPVVPQSPQMHLWGKMTQLF